MTVKGLNIIPNRERREKTVILSGAQYACWVGFPFDCTDCSPSKEFAAKYSSTSACEKSQLIHVFLFKIFRGKKTAGATQRCLKLIS
jgi:hypothetical protein